jgi:hypothetical protein
MVVNAPPGNRVLTVTLAVAVLTIVGYWLAARRAAPVGGTAAAPAVAATSVDASADRSGQSTGPNLPMWPQGTVPATKPSIAFVEAEPRRRTAESPDSSVAAVPAGADERELDLWLKTLQHDPVSGNRLAAIDKLRVLGKQGDSDGRIQASLRAAMNDDDPAVAVNARDALSEVLD